MLYTIVILGIVVLLDIFATRKLLRSTRLLERLKRLHIILVWVVPFVWAILVLMFSDEPPKKNKKFEKNRYMKLGYQDYIVR